MVHKLGNVISQNANAARPSCALPAEFRRAGMERLSLAQGAHVTLYPAKTADQHVCQADVMSSLIPQGKLLIHSQVETAADKAKSFKQCPT